jgi:hypothetical protein
LKFFQTRAPCNAANCQGLKVLLVDERSLIGATTLGWVEFMCRYGVEEGQNFDKTWGGLICCKLTAWLKFFQTRAPCNATGVLPLVL